MADLKDELDADTAKLKASLKSDDLRVKEYTETFWHKYAIYVCLVAGAGIGYFLGKVT